ncbi:putative GTPase activating protein for ARF [Spironucleus salmonicida]|uniref:ARF GAP domain-containing protein n=1 Tax=Spironucleus salmonicida TaxID=348837 RepID=V6LDS3_9EUKA|nr:putative GTPase activating protein for ARF [Spironucleus salmonicida]|eukprot:EST42413.1 ARF GAP domain-containing protein [Spironucleus salmonicida]
MSTKGPWTSLELSLKTQLEQLQKHAVNEECADCTSKGPRWAVFNHGIFVCIKCSGQHRNLGRAISKVKSINMDRWIQDQFDQMIGNELANKIHMCNAPPEIQKPKENEDHKRVKFIEQKYMKNYWRANAEQESQIRQGLVVVAQHQVQQQPQQIQQQPQQQYQQQQQQFQPQVQPQPNMNQLIQQNHTQQVQPPHMFSQQPMQQIQQYNKPQFQQQLQQPIPQQPQYQAPQQQQVQYQQPIVPQQQVIQNQTFTQPQQEIQLTPSPQVPQVEDLLDMFEIKTTEHLPHQQPIITTQETPQKPQFHVPQIRKPTVQQSSKPKQSANQNAKQSHLDW